MCYISTFHRDVQYLLVFFLKGGDDVHLMLKKIGLTQKTMNEKGDYVNEEYGNNCFRRKN